MWIKIDLGWINTNIINSVLNSMNYVSLFLTRRGRIFVVVVFKQLARAFSNLVVQYRWYSKKYPVVCVWTTWNDKSYLTLWIMIKCSLIFKDTTSYPGSLKIVIVRKPRQLERLFLSLSLSNLRYTTRAQQRGRGRNERFIYLTIFYQ